MPKFRWKDIDPDLRTLAPGAGSGRIGIVYNRGAAIENKPRT
jgi:hypothetical protein